MFWLWLKSPILWVVDTVKKFIKAMAGTWGPQNLLLPQLPPLGEWTDTIRQMLCVYWFIPQINHAEMIKTHLTKETPISFCLRGRLYWTQPTQETDLPSSHGRLSLQILYLYCQACLPLKTWEKSKPATKHTEAPWIIILHMWMKRLSAASTNVLEGVIRVSTWEAIPTVLNHCSVFLLGVTSPTLHRTSHKANLIRKLTFLLKNKLFLRRKQCWGAIFTAHCKWLAICPLILFCSSRAHHYCFIKLLFFSSA